MHLYRQMVAEVEPSVRFCAYNLKRLGGEEGGGDEAIGDDALGDMAGAEGTSEILRAKLEQVYLVLLCYLTNILLHYLNAILL